MVLNFNHNSGYFKSLLQSKVINYNYSRLHTFFISNIFISNARPKLGKNQANTKQHHEAELLLFENYSHSSSTLGHILKNKEKNNCACVHEIMRLIIMKMKNRSHRFAMKIDLGLDMDTNIVNIKSVSV